MKTRIIKLLKEPSTLAGIAGVLAGVGLLGLSQEMWQQALAGIGIVLGAIAGVTLDPADADSD